MFIFSGWQIIQLQSHVFQRNFNGFNQFSTFQQTPDNNRHFFYFPRPRQHQSFPPNHNYNQNAVIGSRLNISKWVNYPLVFATTTTAPTKKPEFDFIQPTTPFILTATAPTPEFLDCFGHCPTTSEYNPICASNRQQYHNEQKFLCARHCGQGT